MAIPIENVDLKHNLDNHDSDVDDNVESNVTHSPKLVDITAESNNVSIMQHQQPTTTSPSQTIPPTTTTTTTTQSCVLQQTTVSVHRNGHSRNPSSINGITIATQVIQPPPNKPDAIQSLLKLIRFRSDYEECDEKSLNRQICGIREARLISKWKPRFSNTSTKTQRKKKTNMFTFQNHFFLLLYLLSFYSEISVVVVFLFFPPCFSCVVYVCALLAVSIGRFQFMKLPIWNDVDRQTTMLILFLLNNLSLIVQAPSK